MLKQMDFSLSIIMMMAFIPLWIGSELFMKRSTDIIQVQFSDWQIDVWRVIFTAIFISVIFVVNTSLLFGVGQEKMGSHSQSAGSFNSYLITSVMAGLATFAYFTIRSVSPRDIGSLAEAPLMMFIFTAIAYAFAVYFMAFILATFFRFAGSQQSSESEGIESKTLLENYELWAEFFRSPKRVGELEVVMKEILDDRILEVFTESILKEEIMSQFNTQILLSREVLLQYFFQIFIDNMSRKHGWKEELHEGALQYITIRHSEELIERLIYSISAESTLSSRMIYGILISKGVTEEAIFDDLHGKDELHIFMKMVSILMKSVFQHWRDVGGRFPQALLLQGVKDLTETWGRPKKIRLGEHLDILYDFSSLHETETSILNKLRNHHMFSQYNLDFPSIGIRRVDEIRVSEKDDNPIAELASLYSG